MIGNSVIRIVARTVSRDAYGDETVNEVERLWSGAFYAPRTATVTNDQATAEVITGLTVFGPLTSLGANDQLKVDGVLYDLDGEPGSWINPFTGWEAGMEVAVKRAASLEDA